MRGDDRQHLAEETKAKVITVGCIANAHHSGSDVSVDVTLTLGGPSLSNHREMTWTSSGSESFSEVFSISVPTSTDPYQLDRKGRFSFSCCQQFFDRSAGAQVPSTLTRPTGESTTVVGWDGAQDTVTEYRATLQPSIVNFGGRWLKESTGPGGVTDSCHFEGSACAKVSPIPETGGQLPPGQSHWQDFVGWTPFCASHYRTHSAPCESSTDQSVSINTRGGSAEPSEVYVNNMLRSGITNIAVWNSRAGVHHERIWP